MANIVYEIKFTLTDEESIQSNQDLSSKVKSEKETKQTKDKTDQEISRLQQYVGAVGSAVALTAKGYQNYLYVRNLVNTQKTANFIIQGDTISAQNLAIQTAKQDRIVSMIDSTLSPVITASIATFTSTGSGTATVTAGLVALVQGAISTIRNYISEANTVNAQQRLFNAERNVSNYINNLAEQRLVKNTGYYR